MADSQAGSAIFYIKYFYMKIKSIFLLMLAVQFSISSCLTKIALDSLGIAEKNATLKYATNGEKKIASVYIHHIGKKEYYDDVKYKIDSFLKEGFIVYYEAVRPGVFKDSLQKDTIYRKARKVSGIDLASMKANGGYIDTLNKTIFGKKIKYIVKHNLINQPKYLITISDSIHFKNIDATIVELVDACEKKFEPIILDQYDFEIKLGEKYKFKKNKKMNSFFLEGYRNNLISESIVNDPNKKILLIYGGKHFNGILENLKAADKNYKEVKTL